MTRAELVNKMSLDLEFIKLSLAGNLVGQTIFYRQETGSTNDDAFELGCSGAPEGTVVIAEKQSSGKGRLNREWHSPAGVNILTSIILRPSFSPELGPLLPIMTGVAVAETMNMYCPEKVHLKWPNDVLINERKVSGILAQIKMASGRIEFIVLGIGINVNMLRDQFPAEIFESATSLRDEIGKEVSRIELIIRLYENVAKWYKALVNEGFEPVKRKWLAMTPMIGKKVRVMLREEIHQGTAIGISNEGALILQTAGGKEVKISAGDATIIKE